MESMFKINVPAIKDRIRKGGSITKREFDRLMVKGWKEGKKAYNSGRFTVYTHDDTPVSHCAIGVVAAELGYTDRGYNDGHTFARTLPIEVWSRVANASNAAGNKTRAIKAVKAVEWPNGR